MGHKNLQIEMKAIFIKRLQSKFWNMFSFSNAEMTSFFFTEFSDSSTKFYCKVYFAEQFRQLRKLIFPDGEEM